MTKAGLIRLAPVVALVALLAGCAPTVAKPTTSPVVTNAPTATPTIAPASAPGPRVQVKCSSLYSVDAVARLINATPTIATDETTKPRYLDDVANAQLGTLACVWTGPDGADSFASENLGITIAPDSAAGYAAHAASDLTPPRGGKSYPSTTGDKSGYWCSTTPALTCDAQMLVGNYWVTAQLGADNPNLSTQPSLSTLSTRMRGVLTNVAGHLAAAPAPVPQWVAPATTPPAFCTAPTSTAKLRSIFGVPGYTLRAPVKTAIDADRIATVGRTASCSWADEGTGGTVVDLELVAGGSWVYPGFHTTPYVDGYIRTFTPVDIAGATGADLGCAQHDCQSTLGVGTTLVSVDFPDLGTAKNKAVLAKLAAAIAES